MYQNKIKNLLKQKFNFTDEEVEKIYDKRITIRDIVAYVERKYYTNNRIDLNREVVDDTTKYANKYGFEIGKGEHSTWNNESDAFKHAYMQALLTLRDGEIKAMSAGYYHEKETGDLNGAESQMDFHNNNIGRKVAREYKLKHIRENIDSYSKEVKDEIAREIIKKMNSGELILDPSRRKTPRKQIDLNRNSFSSLDLRIHKSPYRDEMFDLKNRVFYKSEFPSNKENSHLIPEYIHQYYENNGKMPTREDLDKRVRTGELIYVESYTRSDGTKVSGYYRRYPRD